MNMTDISKEAVEAIADDMQNYIPWGRGSCTVRAMQDEIERLKDRLALYEGTKSTPDAPIGMSGLVDDMAGTINSIPAIKAQVWQEAIETALGAVGPAEFDEADFEFDDGYNQARTDARIAIGVIPNPYEVKK